MANKATAKKIVTEVEDDPGVDIPSGSEYVGPSDRKLVSGSVVFLPGSNTTLYLKSDVVVTGDGIGKDQKWVGMLARDQNNWDLNIGGVEGTWNPVTCTRQEDPPAEEAKE